jgi:hypothetical protein
MMEVNKTNAFFCSNVLKIGDANICNEMSKMYKQILRSNSLDKIYFMVQK